MICGFLKFTFADFPAFSEYLSDSMPDFAPANIESQNRNRAEINGRYFLTAYFGPASPATGALSNNKKARFYRSLKLQ
ncbi:MAG TPA: hypothetical protein DCZ91_01540 [Lachnospiraceae bacterium]|nr:hypothetical protein [Lachnospiraceae bacterium]